ncbi:MAG: MarR family winged helix-turn-helix transcriptional regulator [Pseudolabrys sp.]
MSRSRAPSLEATHQVRDQCLCLHAQRAARALGRRFDDAFRPLGLTNGQFSLMMSLNRPEPAGFGSVAALLAMDRTTLTAALKPLERRGWVKSDVDRDDRRARRIALTAAGKKILSRALPIWQSTHAELDRRLRDGDRLRSDLRVLSGEFAAESAG